MIPYKVQAEKIIQAYLKCEIRPYNACACFIGNLLNNNSRWVFARDVKWNFQNSGQKDVCITPTLISNVLLTQMLLVVATKTIKEESDNMYTIYDICQLEQNFLRIYETDDEDSLFKAMTSTLEILKIIHVNLGEVIEEDTQLKKRVLVS